MRFNSPEHLAAWRATGRFPTIHDNIAQLVIEEMCGTRILDLGCSYGLLGARIQKFTNATRVIGVECDSAVIADAIAAGVPVEFAELAVTRETLPQLVALIKDKGLDTLLARRVLPELFGEDSALGYQFADEISHAGIEEIFLEGRVATTKAKNPLFGIAQEVELLARSYREVRRVGACSYLVRRR